VPDEQALAHGNQLLLENDPNYPQDHKRFKVAAHAVDAVARVLSNLGPPTGPWIKNIPSGVHSALDVFVGYLLLDAWTANQDRHHENWGAIRDGGQFSLAPTFDHGASLARNLTDEERHERLTTKDKNRSVPVFARKARSALYATRQERRPLTTVAAWRAFADLAPAAAAAWLARLSAVNPETVGGLLHNVPPFRMSAVCRDFTLYLLEENRNRLLSGETE
jgi:hypothetical protein